MTEEQHIVHADPKAAKEAAKKIDALLTQIASAENSLARNWVRLGTLLRQVRDEQHWMALRFSTFNKYLTSVSDRIGKRRTQLYACIGVAHRLLPVVGEENLIAMGLGKAAEINRMVKATGRSPSEDLIAVAVDSTKTLHDVREMIFEETHVAPVHEGSYFDLGGFYALPEEKEEIEHAFEIAARTDPVIGNEVPAWARLKDIIQRLSREYLATYEQLVLRGEG